MDGTLCDVRSVSHFVERPSSGGLFRRDFEAFHSGSLECPPFPAVVELLRNLRNDGHLVLVVSAREARWAFLTALWLEEHAIAYDEMFLRANGDYRPDAVIKRDIAERISRRFRPRLAIDDRDEIIEVWRSFDIPSAKVLRDGSVIGPDADQEALPRNRPGEDPGGVPQ